MSGLSNFPVGFYKPGRLGKINRDVWSKRPGTFLKNRPLNHSCHLFCSNLAITVLSCLLQGDHGGFALTIDSGPMQCNNHTIPESKVSAKPPWSLCISNLTLVSKKVCSFGSASCKEFHHDEYIFGFKKLNWAHLQHSELPGVYRMVHWLSLKWNLHENASWLLCEWRSIMCKFRFITLYWGLLYKRIHF